jgi:uncharacterized protein
MNIRQLLLDVDKAIVRPSLLEIAAANYACRGVEAVNITVEETPPGLCQKSAGRLSC